MKSEQDEDGIQEDLKRHASGQSPIPHEGIKASALRRRTGLNADRLKYELVYACTGLRPGATEGSAAFANTTDLS